MYFVINANIPRIARFLGVQAVKDFVYLRYLTTLRLMLDMYFFRAMSHNGDLFVSIDLVDYHHSSMVKV